MTRFNHAPAPSIPLVVDGKCPRCGFKVHFAGKLIIRYGAARPTEHRTCMNCECKYTVRVEK